MRKYKLAVLSAFLAVAYSWGGGVSYPSAPVPAARLASGISYDYNGGYLAGFKAPVPTYTQYGANLFATYGLADYVNIGVDLGIKDVNIHSSENFDDLSATPPIVYAIPFYGRMGMAAGPHIKLATPYGGDVFALVLFSRMQWFYSEDSERYRYYRGRDIIASGAFSFHVKNFGYIAMGGKYCDILLESGEIGNTKKYKSVANDSFVGGYIAFDYFPKKTGARNYIPFVSFELGFYPNVSEVLGKSPALRNISFSVTIGGITNRFYGDPDSEWRP